MSRRMDRNISKSQIRHYQRRKKQELLDLSYENKDVWAFTKIRSLSFHKQPLRLEKLTKQGLWSYPIYKLVQTHRHLCVIFILEIQLLCPHQPTTERAKRITANEDVLNSESEAHSRTLCAPCIPSKCEIDDWIVSVPS